MAQVDAHLSTGLAGLDRMLKGLIPGDNIVYRVPGLVDYYPFIGPYCAAARARGEKLIYFRFAKHDAMVPPDAGAEVCRLDPAAGFEAFITGVHKTIERTGRGGYYVFDCLSDLAADWYSDPMLGNFFMLTCPYLLDMEAIACFSVLRNRHSSLATEPIAETAQIVLDVYHHKNRLYLHPLKVQQRYSPTMYMLHAMNGDDFVPVLQSAETTEILSSVPWHRTGPGGYELGLWEQTLLEAQDAWNAHLGGRGDAAKVKELRHRLVRMTISRDDRMSALVEKHLDLGDVLIVAKRMIGTGLIGGKSVGMLLARAIVRQAEPRWGELLEEHDSFYIGSDVFYTFLVRNGIWWVREKQKDPARFLEGAETARRRMLTGEFPGPIVRQFEQMLDYFGQSPIIVRSSSLLEDNFGNSFAGKYDSVFCANQGSRHKRLEDFLSAVRTIYASSMSERALTYRAQRELLDRDEQMALLVQRVSGSLHGSLFYPQVAGVGFSFNPYVWNEQIDPAAGMLRLVFGLGTRAVDRSDDDYTRVVALNAPQLRPEANFDEVRQYSQRRVDVLDLQANQLISATFPEVARQSDGLELEMFASQDAELVRRAQESGAPGVFPWVLTFQKLFADTGFITDMRQMLTLLQQAYEHPVDVEFTANFFESGTCRVNLLQCRPLQVKGAGAITEPPAKIPRTDLVLEAHGAVIGESRMATIDRLVYVSPAAYGQLPVRDRFTVAHLIGQLAHLGGAGKTKTLMLLGPGRWATTTPSLGVPVRYADINTASIICEIVAMRDDLIPDVSLGTHFLNEMVELDILYLALFPHRPDNSLNNEFFQKTPNKLTDLLPEAARWAEVVKVIDVADLDRGALKLYANTLKQKVVCYLER
jgi:pyruvate,water dikinase